MSTEQDRSAAELHSAQRRIEELEALVGTVDLLDPRLEYRELVLAALKACLRVLPADAALLVTRRDDTDAAHYLLRGDDRIRTLEENPSALAREVVESGRPDTRRVADSPGAIAAAEVLGEPPVLRVAVPLRRAKSILGALEVAYRTEPVERFPEETRHLQTVADHVAIALDNARLVRDHANRVRELSHLYDIGTKISSHLDLDSLLGAIIDAIEQLVPVQAVGIFLINRKTREVFSQTLRGYGEGEVERVPLKAGRGIVGWVAKTGEGVIVPDVSLDARYVEARPLTRSEMAAPLKYDGRVIGVFNLESDTQNAYRPHDLDVLLSFSNHAAISIMNAHLHAEAKAKRHLEDQLAVASDIQTALLPRESPQIPGHVLAGRNIPSSAVGGDYFDFIPLAGNRWAIVVADVSGSGIPAGLIMAGFRSLLHAELRREEDPRVVLAQVNRVLCQELDSDHFVTALLGVYKPATGELVYASAGHEAGLLVRSGGAVERLTEGGLLLGVFPDAAYNRSMAHLARGDRLLLYTDGLSDAGDPWGDSLGEEGVLRLLWEAEAENVAPAALPELLLERAQGEAAAPADEADDRTLVLLLRRDGRPRPGRLL